LEGPTKDPKGLSGLELGTEVSYIDTRLGGCQHGSAERQHLGPLVRRGFAFLLGQASAVYRASTGNLGIVRRTGSQEEPADEKTDENNPGERDSDGRSRGHGNSGFRSVLRPWVGRFG
jgi:hypothetical protein